jgi:hypothetical protein
VTPKALTTKNTKHTNKISENRVACCHCDEGAFPEEAIPLFFGKDADVIVAGRVKGKSILFSCGQQAQGH